MKLKIRGLITKSGVFDVATAEMEDEDIAERFYCELVNACVHIPDGAHSRELGKWFNATIEIPDEQIEAAFRPLQGDGKGVMK